MQKPDVTKAVRLSCYCCVIKPNHLKDPFPPQADYVQLSA